MLQIDLTVYKSNCDFKQSSYINNCYYINTGCTRNDIQAIPWRQRTVVSWSSQCGKHLQQKIIASTSEIPHDRHLL